MKRALAAIAVLVALVAAVPALAFDWSLPKFNTSDFQLPSYDWSPSKFSVANPDTWPFIPIPMVATDPNGGTTYGLMPVILFTQQDRITGIFAPDITKNTTLGVGGDFRYLAYPSSDTQWYVEGGGQKTIARYVDVDYQTGRDRTRWWSFEGRFYFEKDPTERFFGLSNHSHEGNQTNYTTKQLFGVVTLGINFTQKLQLALTMRPRWVRIEEGGFTELPSIFQLFPHQKGINGGSELLNQAVLTYDTRDSVDIPRNGGLVRAYAGIADRRFGSSVSYTRFGGEVRRYLTLTQRITLAGHVFMEYEPAGNEMPFWSQARLGGDESLLADQEPLRGYGAGRFIDNNLVVANLEVRTRVYERELFNTHGILELAPFVEAGRVAHEMGYNPLNSLHPVGGIGFRAIAEPFVVGFVDVGWGGQGGAVFSGINYPF